MSECSGNCSSCSSKEKSDDCLLAARMGAVKHKIVVMSGKGGVGKSTVAVNLAKFLADSGKKVGLLDVDLHGPSIPEMLGAGDAAVETADGEFLPVSANGMVFMSVGLVLEQADTPVIWRGPMKIAVIRQLLSEVRWGELDCLIVDCPPGTGDEPLSVCQMIPDADGAVIVTTPQRIAADDVAKSINFCNQLGFKILGIVENMSGFVCPKCGEVTEIFSGDAGKELSERYGIEFLGKLPIDPRVSSGGDAGKPFASGEDSPVRRAFAEIGGRILKIIR